MNVFPLVLYLGVAHYGLSRLFKLPAQYAPIILFSIASCVLFLGALFGFLGIITWILIVSFIGLGLLYLVYDMFTWNIQYHILENLGIFALISLGLFIYTKPMLLAVIDEHVYWAIMGKSLYLQDHLPTVETSILPRHLHYTPGTSLIHYLFFQMNGRYDESIAYWTQSLILLSCLFPVIRSSQSLKNIGLLLLLFVLLHLQYGSVFARLDVDALISASIFSWLVLWTHTHTEPSFKTNTALLLILILMSLIKEIGLYFAIAISVITCVIQSHSRPWLRTIVWILLPLTFHIIWSYYCNQQGFKPFVEPRSIFNIVQDFNPFNPFAQRALILFIRDLMIGPLDRLNTPALAWFSIIAIMYYRFFCKSYFQETLLDPFIAKRVLEGLSFVFILYLIPLYEIQVSTFHLGQGSNAIIGGRRYFNLGFSPIVLWCFYIMLSHYFHRLKSRWPPAIIIVISTGFFIHSYYHRLGVDPEYERSKAISVALHQSILIKPHSHLCVATSSKIDDEQQEEKKRLALQLRHYLLDLSIAVPLNPENSHCDYQLHTNGPQWNIIPMHDDEQHS